MIHPNYQDPVNHMRINLKTYVFIYFRKQFPVSYNYRRDQIRKGLNIKYNVYLNYR